MACDTEMQEEEAVEKWRRRLRRRKARIFPADVRLLMDDAKNSVKVF